jgi:large subunit ribosomal protein L32
MAVPKRKMSRSRTRRRKAQWYKLARPTIAMCPRCKSPIRPHTVCGECGQYQGRTAVEVD